MIVNESYEQKQLRDTLYFMPGTGTEAKLLAKLENGAKEIDADEQMNRGEDECMDSGSVSSPASTSLSSVAVGGIY
ncbi:DNA binding protein [Puccinia graminis f. sp. tritici]|uniref:DNA binding protein n=1 Tax=Puccinia graminis f. sp. tritici TaxID=56615 RepID=A0A5B0N2L6_PUCGR|nr:DNA binding protein [Puccinia graminis f. sp. tritici]KAA1094049.1 DNA binding protein [Puccinia graminis f. sp. tritici]